MSRGGSRDGREAPVTESLFGVSSLFPLPLAADDELVAFRDRLAVDRPTSNGSKSAVCELSSLLPSKSATVD